MRTCAAALRTVFALIICDWADDQAALKREGGSRALRRVEDCVNRHLAASLTRLCA